MFLSIANEIIIIEKSGHKKEIGTKRSNFFLSSRFSHFAAVCVCSDVMNYTPGFGQHLVLVGWKDAISFVQSLPHVILYMYIMDVCPHAM
jgi:hypothetical protein